MVKKSNDLRFVKNKIAMQNAFIELSLEKGVRNVTVKELAERAMVNRMTFYSHYDSLADLVSEYVDERFEELGTEMANVDGFDVGMLMQATKKLLEEQLDFYKMIFTEVNAPFNTTAFRKGYEEQVAKMLEREVELEPLKRRVLASVITAAISYAFFDWVAGRYGDASENEIAQTLQSILTRAVRE